jgi:hypothetical protein
MRANLCQPHDEASVAEDFHSQPWIDHATGETGFDRAILSDTVGFVSNLPTELVAAFRATLEEVSAADLILHVRDIAHPDSEAQAADVETVLSSLGLAEEDSPPRLEVWNKLDLLSSSERDEAIGEAKRRDDVVAVSALTREGVDELRETISHLLHSGSQTHQIRLNAGDGTRIAGFTRGDVIGGFGRRPAPARSEAWRKWGQVRAAWQLASTQSASVSSRLSCSKPGVASMAKPLELRLLCAASSRSVTCREVHRGEQQVADLFEPSAGASAIISSSRILALGRHRASRTPCAQRFCLAIAQRSA